MGGMMKNNLHDIHAYISFVSACSKQDIRLFVNTRFVADPLTMGENDTNANN